MAMAFLCFVIIQGNLCGINLVKRLLWVYDMGWCWGWAELIAIWQYYTEWYTVRPKLEMVLEDFERSVDQTKGCWQIGVFYLFNLLPSNKPIPAKHLWRECRNITKKTYYIYISFLCPWSWGSMSVTVRQKREQQICVTSINQTALGSFHSPAAPHLARPVDVPGKPCAMTPLGKTGSLAQCQRLWLSVPRDACIFLCCFYLCEVWSGKIWCWIWTLADRCGSLPRSCEFSDVLC
jgi:hypothetical protein